MLPKPVPRTHITNDPPHCTTFGRSRSRPLPFCHSAITTIRRMKSSVAATFLRLALLLWVVVAHLARWRWICGAQVALLRILAK